MSRKGNCWSNVSLESFLGYMKDKVDFSVYQTLDGVIAMVDEYIE